MNKSKSYQVLKTRYYKAIDDPSCIGLYVGDIHYNTDVKQFITFVNKEARDKTKGFKEVMLQNTGFGKPTGYLYFKEA